MKEIANETKDMEKAKKKRTNENGLKAKEMQLKDFLYFRIICPSLFFFRLVYIAYSVSFSLSFYHYSNRLYSCLTMCFFCSSFTCLSALMVFFVDRSSTKIIRNLWNYCIFFFFLAVVPNRHIRFFPIHLCVCLCLWKNFCVSDSLFK